MYRRFTTAPAFLSSRWRRSLAKGPRWFGAQAEVAQALPKKDMLALVKELRQMSGSPIKDCKKALQTSEGDMDKAWDFLRAQGIATARKKAGNVASKGLIACTESPCGRSAVIVEVNTETEFCEDNSKFQALAREISDAVLPCEGSAFPTNEAALEAVVLPISEHRSESVVLSQAVTDLVASIRENIKPRRAARIEVGENGIVGAYVHGRKAPGIGLRAGLVGLTTEPACPAETRDVIAKLAKDIAMHVVASSPRPKYIARDEVTEAEVERERAVLMDQLEQEGKVPEDRRAGVVQGKLKQFYADMALLENNYVLADDSKTTVQMVLDQSSKETGVQIKVADFVAYTLGETVRES